MQIQTLTMFEYRLISFLWNHIKNQKIRNLLMRWYNSRFEDV